ncbi:MAG: hypothetical protein OH316_00010 [Candidatus Parvarchaeota archaeon]|nr:hypothetical protein [Candidatus Parvarchaeota archaeon]MCW1301514.1 hypothetical protein [Candidatus Parvarchaeota archaeon]
MEKFGPIIDCSIEDINRLEEVRIRTVGEVMNVDEIGIFIIKDERDNKIVCMPSPDMKDKPNISDLVCVTGKIVKSDGGPELRVDNIEKISEKDADNFNKYLKIRGELLDNGSGNK